MIARRLGVLSAVFLTILGLTALRLSGPVIGATTSRSALPYYDSRDFTPKWFPVGHRVAPFNLVDQKNQTISEKDLDGTIHVASFIFTTCPSVCPVLVERLKPVQQATRDMPDVMMISYSVTPLTDTPEVLAEFGRLRGIEPDRWRLLTGDIGQVRAVLRDSYFADDDRPTEGEPPSRLLHTEKVLLVDRNRNLRGIYNGTNAFEMQRLLEDIDALRRSN